MRDKRIDLAKAIGICLVVLGHAGMPNSSIIFRFHMALFFALSGYCFRDKHIASFKQLLTYLKNKVLGLYVPFVLFNGITLLLRNILIRLNIYTNDERFLENVDLIYLRGEGNAYGLTIPLDFQEMKPWILNVLRFSGESQLGGATWFLRVLFGITVTWAIINYIIKTVAKFDDRECLLINAIISGMSIWVAYVWMRNSVHLPMQFETVVAVYSIYTIGYYMQHHNEKTTMQNLTIVIISSGILYYCDSRCLVNGWNSNVNEYANPFMYLISSFSGIALVLSVAALVGKLKYTKLLEYIGQHTLAVLMWHFIAFKIVIFLQLLIYNQPIFRLASFPVLISSNGWWIVYFFVGIIIPIAIAYIFNAFKSMFWRQLH